MPSCPSTAARRSVVSLIESLPSQATGTDRSPDHVEHARDLSGDSTQVSSAWFRQSGRESRRASTIVELTALERFAAIAEGETGPDGWVRPQYNGFPCHHPASS